MLGQQHRFIDEILVTKQLSNMLSAGWIEGQQLPQLRRCRLSGFMASSNVALQLENKTAQIAVEQSQGAVLDRAKFRARVLG